ncbi:MAG: DUF4126 domain-containing protein [Acidobacteria bacterium]|nr:DUF4126 domain-containing protein [Acidobacteriota bacterium]
MAALETLGFVLGTAFASGLNLYATIAALGLLHRYDAIHLPSTLEVLSHPVVLIAAIALYAIEFVADKIPYVDNIWDMVHTFIRPPAAALLAYSAFGEVSEGWSLAAALLAGGVALTSHGTKASTRVAVNASPEPFSNSIASLTEDGIALGLTWLAGAYPVLAFGIVLVLVALSAYLIYKFFGLLRKALRRMFSGSRSDAPPRRA